MYACIAHPHCCSSAPRQAGSGALRLPSPTVRGPICRPPTYPPQGAIKEQAAVMEALVSSFEEEAEAFQTAYSADVLGQQVVLFAADGMLLCCWLRALAGLVVRCTPAVCLLQRQRLQGSSYEGRYSTWSCPRFCTRRFACVALTACKVLPSAPACGDDACRLWTSSSRRARLRRRSRQ